MKLFDVTARVYFSQDDETPSAAQAGCAIVDALDAYNGTSVCTLAITPGDAEEDATRHALVWALAELYDAAILAGLDGDAVTSARETLFEVGVITDCLGANLEGK